MGEHDEQRVVDESEPGSTRVVDIRTLVSEKAPATERSNELRPGVIIDGKYGVLRILGAGGMGVVGAAKHLELATTVALKVMRRESAHPPDAVRRFLREGRSAARLTSDNAVRIYDVGRLPNGLPFLVMEYLEGQDLAAIRKERTPSIAEVVDWITQACNAVAEAHEKGLVHRDIKPANLFLARLPNGEQRIKVLDFGLAKEVTSSVALYEDGSKVTSEHTVLGSPEYMSPEQIRSTATAGPPTDIWALGVTIHHLLTGRSAFSASTVHELMACIFTDPAPRPSALRADVPPWLDDVVARCLAKSPGDRFASIANLVAALHGRVSHSSIVPLPSITSMSTTISTETITAPPIALDRDHTATTARTNRGHTSRAMGAFVGVAALLGFVGLGLGTVAVVRGQRATAVNVPATTTLSTAIVVSAPSVVPSVVPSSAASEAPPVASASASGAGVSTTRATRPAQKKTAPVSSTNNLFDSRF